MERQLELHHRITIEGILFILFAFAIGFAAYNTGNALLYLILSMMLAFLAFSGFMAYQMLSGLEARRRVPGRLFARTPADVTLELTNAKRRCRSYSLRLRDELASVGAHGLAYLLILEPRSTASAPYRAIFPRRGVHRLDTLHIFTRYPFGFFERHLALPMPQEVLVYPQIHGFRTPPIGALVRLGEYSRPERGEGVELRAMRDYAPGDPARSIHWKATARSGSVIVKEMEKEAERRYDLILNNAVPHPDDAAVAEAFEEAVDFVASLIVWLGRRGIGLTLYTRSGRLTFRGQWGELDRALRTLALLPLLPEAEAGALPPRPRGDTALQVGFAAIERRFSPLYLPIDEWRALLGGSLDGSEAVGSLGPELHAGHASGPKAA